jgi:hypothetical protein
LYFAVFFLGGHRPSDFGRSEGFWGAVSLRRDI